MDFSLNVVDVDDTEDVTANEMETMNWLQCSTCRQTYGSAAGHENAPRMMSCGHSVCDSCIKSLPIHVHWRDFPHIALKRCPICGDEFNLDVDVSINYAIIDVVSEKKKEEEAKIARREMEEAAKILLGLRAPICSECDDVAPRGVFLFCATCDSHLDQKRKICVFCSCQNHVNHRLMTEEEMKKEGEKVLEVTERKRTPKCRRNKDTNNNRKRRTSYQSMESPAFKRKTGSFSSFAVTSKSPHSSKRQI